MSHHYSGPDFGFPQGDLTDLFAFPKRGDARKSIVIMVDSRWLGLGHREVSMPTHQTTVGCRDRQQSRSM
jgi:hypothetical protein